MTAPWLSDDEIDEMCAGVVTNAARARHLRRMGLTVTAKPNGRPLVMRAHAERVLSGLAELPPAANEPKTAARPNREALILNFGKKAA